MTNQLVLSFNVCNYERHFKVTLTWRIFFTLFCITEVNFLRRKWLEGLTGKNKNTEGFSQLFIQIT